MGPSVEPLMMYEATFLETGTVKQVEDNIAGSSR